MIIRIATRGITTINPVEGQPVGANTRKTRQGS
jgi:hypothetical protein